MRIFLSGMIALVALCRLAQGGEGGLVAGADPGGALFRLLTDFGALGAFVIYLIWDKRRDREKRDEDSKRWYALDRELVGLVRECTAAIAESANVLADLRKDIWRLSPVNEHPPEARQSAATKAMRRNEVL